MFWRHQFKWEQVHTFAISEWAHHSDHDRDSWDRHPEEEDRECQDEADNRDKGNLPFYLEHKEIVFSSFHDFVVQLRKQAATEVMALKAELAQKKSHTQPLWGFGKTQPGPSSPTQLRLMHQI